MAVDVSPGAMSADEAMMSRRSIRAFLTDPVPQAMIEDLLAVASRAPSGTNTQPWKVYVVQSVMIAARARGLHTCPQAAFVPYSNVVGEALGMGEDEVLVCGMALGWADTAAVENGLVTERAPVTDFTTFLS